MKRLWSFEPQWYEQQHLKLTELRERDPNKTWGHPMDAVLVIATVLTLTLLFVGVFG